LVFRKPWRLNSTSARIVFKSLLLHIDKDTTNKKVV
jgi:hypothetical protein